MVLSKIKGILRSKGYELYTKPHELNIVGIRSASTIPNRFDDEIHVFYKVAPLKWFYHVYKVTTDPGTFWLRNPMQPQGTAILAQGQYKGAYRIGLHQGKYKALVEAKPLTVIRDYDRDAKLDFRNGAKSKGMFGINIHRASLNGITKQVDKYSAGCQVFANINEFNEFMGLAEKHRSLRHSRDLDAGRPFRRPAGPCGRGRGRRPVGGAPRLRRRPGGPSRWRS